MFKSDINYFYVSYSCSKQKCINKDATNCLIVSKKNNPQVLQDRINYFNSSEGMLFENTTTTIRELTDNLITGHTIAPCFNLLYRKSIETGYFTMSEKTNKNFSSSQFLAIDVDNSDIDLQHFLGILWDNDFLPTTAYTTYSNNKTNGVYKFRAIYVLESTINDFLRFRFYSNQLIEHIEQLTGQEVDKCCLRASQYYNGTLIRDEQGNENPNLIDPYVMPDEYIGNIYSIRDIPNTTEKDFIKFLSNGAGYEKSTQKKYSQAINDAIYYISKGLTYKNEDLPDFDEEETTEWILNHYNTDFNFTWWLSHKKLSECLERFQRQYPFFYRNCCADSYNGWDKKFGNVLRIPMFEGYWRIKDPTNGKGKLGKGEHRKKALKQFLTESRLMFPDITYPYLFTQGLIFINSKIDNSDKKISLKGLERMVNNIMRLEDDEFEDEYGYIKETRIDFAKTMNKNWIYKSGQDYRDFAKTETKNILQNNIGLTPKEQLKKVQEERGVSTRQAYRNIKKAGLDIKEESTIYNILDETKSLNWNIKEVRSKGYGAGKPKIKRILEKKQKDYMKP